MFANVVIFSRSFDDKGLLYAIPDDILPNLQLGQIVQVPFKNEVLLGVMIDIFENHDSTDTIKPLVAIHYPEPLLTPTQISLLKYISEHYFNLIHQTLTLFFPKNLKEKLEKETYALTPSKTQYSYTFHIKNTLTEVQNKTKNEILEHKKTLLYGVTGSGKTEIYIHLIQKILEEGKQSLLLVPEIILTSHLAERIAEVFGDQILLINSTVSPAKRTKYFNDIRLNKAKIIVGTRSAIFYPYQNLGLVIVDEEHDESYISKDTPRYDAFSVLLHMQKIAGFRLLLASGTPKISHIYRASKGDLHLASLLQEISLD